VKPIDWSTCGNPDPMIRHLRGKVSDRKVILFSVACCRRVWHLLEDERSRRAVEIAELFADGQVGIGEHRDATREAYAAAVELRTRAYPPRSPDYPRRRSEWDPARVAASHAASAAAGAPRRPGVWDLALPPYRMARDVAREASSAIQHDIRSRRVGDGPSESEESAFQSGLLRDIVGDPNRTVPLDPTWLTSTAIKLAEPIYAERAFDRLPYLGDLLEQEGCTSSEVLEHCRSGTEHVRGCWVVDLVLGRG
jgi:hypothetical protein